MAKRTDKRSQPAQALTPQEIHEALMKKPFSPEQQEVLAQLRWGRSIQEAMTSIGYSRSTCAPAAPSPSGCAGRTPRFALRSPTFMLGKTSWTS